MTIDVKWEGLEELSARLNNIVRSVDYEQASPILLDGAWRIAGTAKVYAPLGPTGNLKKANQAKMLPKIGNLPPVAVAKVNARTAPHAHLVERGTGERIAKKGKYKGRRFGRMPANPFFTRAVTEKIQTVLEDVTTKLQGLIEQK